MKIFVPKILNVPSGCGSARVRTTAIVCGWQSPATRMVSLRDFTLAYYEQCKRCHFANYTKTLDSVHFKALERRDRMAPTCVDCHGGDASVFDDKARAHAKEKGFLGRPSRSQAALFCGTCHGDVDRMRPYGLRTDVLDAYRSSHHGKAHSRPPLGRLPAGPTGTSAERRWNHCKTPLRDAEAMKPNHSSSNVPFTPPSPIAA